MPARNPKGNQPQKPQQQEPPEDEWERDLRPNHMAGQNISGSEAMDPHGRTAHDVKELHSRLEGFTARELREIPVLPAGERLEQGASYFDLAHPERGEFTAEGSLRTTNENLYVPKSRVHHELWNRLTRSGPRR